MCMVIIVPSLGLDAKKTCLRGFANNKGVDQPAHQRRLISAFVIRLLETIISKLATSEISFFYLVSVAEETGLSLGLSETPKTGFVVYGNYSTLSVTSHINCIDTCCLINVVYLTAFAFIRS